MNSESEGKLNGASPALGRGEEPDRPPETPDRVILLGAYVTHLRTSLACGTVVGLLEAAWTSYRVGVPYGRSGDLPGMIFLGASGRLVLVHALFWTLLAATYGLPLSWWLARRAGTGSRMQSVGPSLSLCILLGGTLCIPVGLDMMELLTAWSVSALLATTAVLSLVVFLAFLWAPGSKAIRWCTHALRWSPVPCLVLLVLGTCAMYATPFRGVDSYRVPSARKKRPPRGAGPPNILWVVMDTVRADRLSCYGYHRRTTPFLERFATESVVYDRAVASAYWTVPTHASMFTGLPARAHGASRESAWLGDEHVTVAEVLSEQGYQCVLFSNNPYIAKDHNFSQGFEHAPACNVLDRLGHSILQHWCEWFGLGPVVPWFEMDAGAALTNAEIAAWLDRAGDPTRPFMLFVNYMEAHLPYQAPRRIRAMLMDPAEVSRSYDLRRRAYGDLLGPVLTRFNLLDPTCIERNDLVVLAALYDASLRYLDGRIEELLSIFEQRGLRDNTIVVVTSDHGESLGEHRRWGHHYGLYDTLVHVPLIIRFPDHRQVGRVETLVQTTDLFATLARWAGARPTGIEGLQSWDLNNTDAARAEERMAVAEYLTHDPRRTMWATSQDPAFDTGPYVRRMRAAVQGRHKFIWTSDGRNELYDLAADPGETNNIIDAEPGVAGRMSSKLKTWVESVPRYSYPQGKKKPDLSPALIRQLRALGYLQ